MQPKTEEFLYLMLWSAEVLLNPTFRNLTDSFESWAYRKGLMRQLALLEQRKWLERDARAPNERLYRLTAQARLHAIGGRDPEDQWARGWDGKWRMVLFDVPTGQNVEREKLRRYLRSKGFGCLQKSVWVTPDPLSEERKLLKDGEVDVETLLLLEARPCAGESDAEIVQGAWNFEAINSRYSEHLEVLDRHPQDALTTEAAAKRLQRWAAMEREAWLNAVSHDPLLPGRLLPSEYLGQKAWRRRVEVLRTAGRQLKTFRLH